MAFASNRSVIGGDRFHRATSPSISSQGPDQPGIARHRMTKTEAWNRSRQRHVHDGRIIADPAQIDPATRIGPCPLWRHHATCLIAK